MDFVSSDASSAHIWVESVDNIVLGQIIEIEHRTQLTQRSFQGHRNLCITVSCNHMSRLIRLEKYTIMYIVCRCLCLTMCIWGEEFVILKHLDYN